MTDILCCLTIVYFSAMFGVHVSTLLLLICLVHLNIADTDKSVNNGCQQIPACGLCKCKTKKNLSISVDCSNRKLICVPKFPANTTEINLSSNKLKTFPGSTEFPPNLVHLDMSKNKIARLQRDSFRNFPLLQTLNLQSNDLSYNLKTYPPGVFRRLVSLKSLNLKDNVERNTTGEYYPHTVFQDLTSLESLHLDGLVDAKFRSGFANLKNLSRLDLSGSNGRCHLNIVTSELFKHFKYLRVLDMSVCKIIRIENGTFRHLTYLEELDISYNKDLTFAVLQNVTFDLQFTKVKIFRAIQLHRTFGIGTQIFKKDMFYMRNTTIEELYLDKNRLEMIELDAALYTPINLSIISFGDNKLTMGYYIFNSLYMENLKILNASFQFYSHNSYEAFQDTSKGTCDLYVRSPCEDLDHSNSVRRQDFSKVRPYPNLKSDLDLMLNLPPKLEVVHFNSSLIRYKIPRLSFNPNNEIKFLNFSGNILYEWSGPVVHLNKLKVLDLSNTYCSEISTEFFKYTGSLEKLYISNNYLGDRLEKDELGEIFQALENLRELDLAQNRIQNLSGEFFHSLFNLTKLHLGGNIMRDWTFDISHMLQLEFIDISHNNLMQLPNKVMRDLDNISRNRTVSLDLSGNNILCKCETLPFLKWTLETQTVKLVKSNHYKCHLDNGTKISFTDLGTFVPELELQCSSKMGLIIVVTTSVFVSIFIVVFGIVYRYRWKIRYMYYIAKNRYGGYIKVPRDDEDDEYEFDAFISYADEDRKFVHGDLRQNLELCEDRCSLCIHGRDFTPGISIAANITKAINSSRKTIILLSRSFLSSEWCMYEFNMARMESIYNRQGRNVMFIIFYENVPACELPMTLLEIIETKSYIEYPNDPEGNVVFWDKIKETIKNRI